MSKNKKERVQRPSQRQGKMVCLYRFPLHPQDMCEQTPSTVNPQARILRMHLIGFITRMSQCCSQQQLDEQMMLDVDERGNITGMGMGLGMCKNPARAVPLGQLTAENWIHMTVPGHANIESTDARVNR